MLEFNTPNINDIDWARPCLSKAKSFNNEYSFTGVYLWSTAYKTKFAHYKDFFICRWGKDGDLQYSLPIGEGNFEEAVNEIIEDAKLNNVTAKIYGITDEYKPQFNALFGDKITYYHEDGFNDYIYLATDLANLSGKKYHSKRNHIANFKRNNPNWCYEPIDENNIDECIELHTNWIEDRDENDADYSLEFDAVLKGFENYERLGFDGGIIRVNGKAIAYTYGERKSEELFVSHFEKAPNSIHGAYAIINQQFAEHLLSMGVKYINREEDLGLEGLRKAKQSYHPYLWLKKDMAVFDKL